MNPIIKPSSELRKNYNHIAELCRSSKAPIFLTRNGEGDTVIMDIETYTRRESELLIAAQLLESQRRRMTGDLGYTVDELEFALTQSIAKAGKEFVEHGS